MSAETYALSVQSRGNWGFTVRGLEEDELDGAIERIHRAKEQATSDPGIYFQITTGSGQTTRIYGNDIAGFNFQQETT